MCGSFVYEYVERKPIHPFSNFLPFGQLYCRSTILDVEVSTNDSRGKKEEDVNYYISQTGLICSSICVIE